MQEFPSLRFGLFAYLLISSSSRNATKKRQYTKFKLPAYSRRKGEGILLLPGGQNMSVTNGTPSPHRFDRDRSQRIRDETMLPDLALSCCLHVCRTDRYRLGLGAPIFYGSLFQQILFDYRMGGGRAWFVPPGAALRLLGFGRNGT